MDERALRFAAELATLAVERLRGAEIPAPKGPPGRLAADRGEWLTAGEVISMLALPSRGALDQMVRRGTLPAHHLSPRRIRFKRSELEQVLARRSGRPLRVITRTGEDAPAIREDDGARACHRLGGLGE